MVKCEPKKRADVVAVVVHLVLVLNSELLVNVAVRPLVGGPTGPTCRCALCRSREDKVEDLRASQSWKSAAGELGVGLAAWPFGDRRQAHAPESRRHHVKRNPFSRQDKFGCT